MEQKFKASMIVCCYVLLDAMSFSDDYLYDVITCNNITSRILDVEISEEEIFMCTLYLYL